MAAGSGVGSGRDGAMGGTGGVGAVACEGVPVVLGCGKPDEKVGKKIKLMGGKIKSKASKRNDQNILKCVEE